MSRVSVLLVCCVFVALARGAVLNIRPGVCDGNVTCEPTSYIGEPLLFRFELNETASNLFATAQIVGLDNNANVTGALQFLNVNGVEFENRSYSAVPLEVGYYRFRVGMGGFGLSFLFVFFVCFFFCFCLILLVFISSVFWQ